MSAGGTMIAQVIIHEGLEITYLGWSSERFYLMDRDTDTTPVIADDITPCTIILFSSLVHLVFLTCDMKLHRNELKVGINMLPLTGKPEDQWFTILQTDQH